MEDTRKQNTTGLFNNISGTYDLTNHLMTFRLDRRWRKKTIEQLKPFSPCRIIDIATGTGDLAIAAQKLNPQEIVGIDLAENMLSIARQKAEKKKLTDRISFQTGDAEAIPFPNEYFDAATVAFGIRNFAQLEKVFAEILRVLKPGGAVSILETSRPKKFPMKQLHRFYFKKILPLLGRLIAKDKSVFQYFTDTVMTFPQRDDLLKRLKNAGFSESFFKSLGCGTVTIYLGVK